MAESEFIECFPFGRFVWAVFYANSLSLSEHFSFIKEGFSYAHLLCPSLFSYPFKIPIWPNITKDIFFVAIYPLFLVPVFLSLINQVMLMGLAENPPYLYLSRGFWKNDKMFVGFPKPQLPSSIITSDGKCKNCFGDTSALFNHRQSGVDLSAKSISRGKRMRKKKNLCKVHLISAVFFFPAIMAVLTIFSQVETGLPRCKNVLENS